MNDSSYHNNNNNNNNNSSSWVSLRDSNSHDLAADTDDFQMYMDALEQYQDDSDEEDNSNASFSFRMEEEEEEEWIPNDGTTARQGVCFNDTVQEFSGTGQISQVPLKNASEEQPSPSDSMLDFWDALRSYTTTRDTDEGNNNNSGSLQSLNLWEDIPGEETTSLHTSSIRDMIQQAVLQAWSDDDNILQEHSASQREMVFVRPRARHPGLTLQYVRLCMTLKRNPFESICRNRLTASLWALFCYFSLQTTITVASHGCGCRARSRRIGRPGIQYIGSIHHGLDQFVRTRQDYIGTDRNIVLCRRLVRWNTIFQLPTTTATVFGSDRESLGCGIL
jgi:hypothetical protein